MSILDNIVRRLGYYKAVNYPQWLQATAAVEKFRIPDGSMWESQAELYQRLSWVHIAVSITASSCAVVPFSVKKMVGEDEEDIVNHPFEELLHNPNPLMSRFEFIESTVAYRALTGNAYWWLNRTSENTAPAEMWVIPSHKIQPVPDEKLYIKGYAYDPGDGRKIALEPWEVVHFKRYHPLNTFIGLSPIEALATISVGDLKMQDWNTRLFGESNARLPGILAFADPIPDSEWDKIKADTREKAAKRELMMLRNAGKGGVEWMQAAMSQKDMEFLAGRKFTKEEIFATFAPGLASMIDVNATEANSKTGKATFTDFSLWPILTAMAEKITNTVLPAYDEKLLGEFDDIRYTDRAIELQEQAEFAKSHTIDEIRAEYYGDDELGDDRGKMLPAQVGASPVTITDDEDEEPLPAPFPFQPKPAEQPEEGENRSPEQSEGAEAVNQEMKAWEKFAINRLGKSGRPFQAKAIPPERAQLIAARLETAETEEQIKVVFAKQPGEIDSLIAALLEATRALRETSE